MNDYSKIFSLFLQDGRIEEYLREKLKNDYLIRLAIESLKRKVEKGKDNIGLLKTLSSYRKYCIEDENKNLEFYRLKENIANLFPAIFAYAFSENHENNIFSNFICCYLQSLVLIRILKK